MDFEPACAARLGAAAGRGKPFSYDSRMRDLQMSGRRMTGLKIAFALIGVVVAVIAVAGCGSSSSDVGPAAPSTTSSSSGMVLPGGGLSVAEALASDAEPPLAVGGWVVGSGAGARLCSGYTASANQPCVEPSLALEGAGDIKNGTHVSLLGAVKGHTFVVASTVQG